MTIGRSAHRKSVVAIWINETIRIDRISKTGAAKEEKPRNEGIRKNAGTDGCASVNGAAYLFLTINLMDSVPVELSCFNELNPDR